MNAGIAVAKELAQAAKPVLDEAERNEEILSAANVTQEDRDFVRAGLVEAAEHIRKKYPLKIPAIRSFLHEMVEVSV